MQNFIKSIIKSKMKKFPKNDHFKLPFRMCTLYNHLQDTIDNVRVIEKGMVPAMSKYDSETSKLIIFDDLGMEPKRTQAQISLYFIRGRKQGWSMIYISQSYFRIPKTIRINSQYVILDRNLTQRDLGIICRDFPADIPIKTLIDLYKRTISEKMTTMLMDITDRKIYRNVIEFICD
ncbi:uncharacterized protein PITG_16305 [Phytophthora infestans T30-4]|uniref:Uncharacterized protein n=1 Tax=Phytophthora infestans (strain T30-4) TaxID=403677 RepID=D0NTY8_PHYIT|nr:uncharacterized protein PITG_16305 [Phytophthora infestans T30-4]EEY65112.1 conserved hypothetical protein [Phytophthora infestans T30-4]|eukprot:XP_002897369.1 conserved hypothetical protein [Phytophthora infestans T30-4]